VQLIKGTLAASSGAVTLTIHPGEQAEQAYNAASEFSCTLTAGTGDWERPRVRCGSYFVKLTGTPGSRWAMEVITIEARRLGLSRT
jgi:hypothetical protein